jgi:hypothetical protein
VHYVLADQTPKVTDVLEGMHSTAPVTGSKFVFDTDLTRSEIMSLQAKLGRDVRLIHLTRSYRDVFLSRRRGFYRRLNVAQNAAIGQSIKAAILEADLPNITPSSDAQIVEKFFEELREYIHNDAAITLLSSAGNPYFHVEYDEINNRLAEIAQFIESAATPTEIAEMPLIVLRHPTEPIERLEAAGEFDDAMVQKRDARFGGRSPC